jgi:hypothetical protein
MRVLCSTDERERGRTMQRKSKEKGIVSLVGSATSTTSCARIDVVSSSDVIREGEQDEAATYYCSQRLLASSPKTDVADATGGMLA